MAHCTGGLASIATPLYSLVRGCKVRKHTRLQTQLGHFSLADEAGVHGMHFACVTGYLRSLSCTRYCPAKPEHPAKPQGVDEAGLGTIAYIP